MSREKELVGIIEKTLPFPSKVIVGYARLGGSFTSGDLARVTGISASSAKFYLNKMVELRMVVKIPHKRRYQKYVNADTISNWMRDFIKLALIPLESGGLKPSNEG